MILFRLSRVLLIFRIIFCTSTLSLYAQNVTNYTIADGLTGNSIKCIYKDTDGLLWIATETGLNTFDGIKFKIIGEKEGLKYNSIWKIAEDDKKNIWLSAYGNGVIKYDRKTFTYYNTKSGLVNDQIRSMYYSKQDHCMVFGTENGLSVFDGKKFKNFVFRVDNLNGKFQVNFISKYKNKILFGVNFHYVYLLDLKPNINKSIIRKFFDFNTHNYSGLIKGKIFYNRDFNNELALYNLSTKQKKSVGKCPLIWDFCVSSKSVLYCAAWEGNNPSGGVLELKNNQIRNFAQEKNLPTEKFWCLYYDEATDRLWAGSVDKGIFVFDLSKRITSETSPLIVGKEINTLCFDNDQNLWLGGQNVIIKKNEKGIKILTNENLTRQILSLIKSRFDPNNQFMKIFLKKSKCFICHSLILDHRGNIWAMTNYGLLCIDQNLKLIQYQFTQETSGLIEFIDKNQLFLSQKYSHCYTVPFPNIRAYKSINELEKYAPINASKIVKQKNNIWVASATKGLFLFQNGKWKSFHALGLFKEINISELIIDKNDNLIIGSVNGKIYSFKWRNKQFIQNYVLEPEKHIVGNSIYFIRKFKSFLFVGTNKGINILKDNKFFKFLSKEEGLLPTQYTDAVIDEPNKKLIISTNDGLIYIDLKRIVKIEKLNNPIYLSEIKINDRKVNIGRLANLQYFENNLEIKYASNNIQNASKNYFRYKILGLSEHWSTFTNETSLKLFDIKNGNYSIIIEGKNIGTGEKFVPFKIRISIKPPFWKTNWFYILVASAITLLISLYINTRIKSIKLKSAIEKRIAETKLQALQSQMNPHFVFNAMNSIQNFVIDNKTDDALWYMGEFSKLMRQTLDFSSRSNIHLEEELDYLKRYIDLENLRRKVKVDCVMFVPENLDAYEIQIPPLLIEPIIENVFVHAFDEKMPAPQIKIEFQLLDSHLSCKIADNGRGIESTNFVHKKYSKGLYLIEERIRLISKVDQEMVKISKNTEGGTIVTLLIPLR